MLTTMSTPVSIAILITCHNRRETTLNCLARLTQQSTPTDVYLVDDGSSDGTSDAVRSAYPQVKLLQGDGNLYWGGGMRMAFSAAMHQGYDYYLWLNDDTFLAPNAIAQMLSVQEQLRQRGILDAIVVGSTQDAENGQPSYGGARLKSAWYSNKYELIPPSSEIQPCTAFFGNCILIPRAIAQAVGNIDPDLIHNFGDIDYGLRAKALGYSSWIAPGYIATCAKNSVSGTWADPYLPAWQRLQGSLHIKAFPIRPWTIFTMRHSGLFWVFYWVFPYLRAILGYRNVEVSSGFFKDKSSVITANSQAAP